LPEMQFSDSLFPLNIFSWIQFSAHRQHMGSGKRGGKSWWPLPSSPLPAGSHSGGWTWPHSAPPALKPCQQIIIAVFKSYLAFSDLTQGVHVLEA